MQAEEPADLPRFLLRPDKQHAIKLAESGDTKLLRMYYPELAGVFDRVRKPRGGNRIKGISPAEPTHTSRVSISSKVRIVGVIGSWMSSPILMFWAKRTLP